MSTAPRTALPRTALASIAPDLRELLETSAALHDHLCPRQVLGVRMGMYAAELLNLDHPQHDKQLLAIVETDGCFADGVAVATGCWLGHRTLRCVDVGKVAATFVDTHTSTAVRLRPSLSARTRAALYAPDEVDSWHRYLLGYQVMPVTELLDAERVRLVHPVEILVSSPNRKAICNDCGEEIFNAREVVANGRVLCLACAGSPHVVRDTPNEESR